MKRTLHAVVVTAAIAVAALACGSFGARDDAAPTDDASVPDAANETSTIETGDAATTDAAVVDPSLLAWWKLDETGGTKAADALGKNDGTLKGGSFVAGKIGNAFSTGGTGSIAVGYETSLAIVDALTVACWVSLSASTDEQWIYTHGYQFYVKLNGRHPQFSTSDANYKLFYDLPVDEWHHLAVTFAVGTGAKIYIDGLERSANAPTLTSATTLATDIGTIRIAGDSAGGTNPVGLVDDVRLYNRALTAAEVAALAK